MMSRAALAAILVSTAVALQLSAGTSSALIVDQANTPIPNLFINIFDFRPVGQSFTPTFDALNVVELLMEDASCSGVGAQGGSVLVRIHAGGTVVGPVVGTSSPRQFPNCFNDVLRFEFGALVPLVPGALHFLETVYVSGDTATVGIFTGLSTYAGGQLLFTGLFPLPGGEKDLWFREGLEVSEPHTLLIFTIAIIAFAAWSRSASVMFSK